MLITILAGAFILSIVIVVHEFGHFIVAKKAGVFVKTFSVGFGRKIVKKRFGETVYALSLLPFGGYVKFAGESEEVVAPKEAPQGDSSDEIPDSEIDPSRYFINKRPLVRSAVVFAGPFANYVLAIVVYIAMFAVHGTQTIPHTIIGEVEAGSAADSIGLMTSDRVVAVDGERVANWGELVDTILEDTESSRAFTVERGSQVLELAYKPRLEDGAVRLGFSPHISATIGQVKRDAPAYQAGMRTGDVIATINDTLIDSYLDIERIIHANPKVPLVIEWTKENVQHVDTITPQARKVLKDGSKTEFKIVGQIGIGPNYARERVPLHRATVMAVRSSTGMVVEIVSFLKLLVTGKAGVDAVGGPILITQMAGDMARWGFNYLLYFLAFFSINLCIFNLLPMLPFDGGHLTLFAYEGVTRRRVNRRVREILTQAGFILLILLMAFVVLIDVSRCTGSSPGLF
ncbi:MAG: RIP metalloprotease RseP [Candidatus Krumholzibacteria bacterium]|nr:RIP metalloprotease RseP [Candidatus Krumholzibacteria bacterium]